MPFVPRSQLEQKQQAAAPPTMPVVEEFQRQEPAPDPHISHENTEEQIAELNELLIHVLDELADLKRTLQTNAPKKQRHKQTGKRRPPSDDEETSEEESDEHPSELERAVEKPSTRKTNATPARPKGYDFSGCF